jgi:hypothetical protein
MGSMWPWLPFCAFSCYFVTSGWVMCPLPALYYGIILDRTIFIPVLAAHLYKTGNPSPERFPDVQRGLLKDTFSGD